MFAMEMSSGQSAAMVLKQYFGLLPNQSVGAFAQELKALGDDEKRELAQVAAQELGVTLKEKTDQTA
jgi:ABC-type proline/glycine betaine transport system ATPase subunit